MKAISLTQPWATLIALGEKKFETRSWPTRYRGPIAIHASKAFPGWAKEMASEMPFYEALRPGGTYMHPELTLGVIVCVTSIVGCYTTEWGLKNLDKKELAFGDYGEGRWCFKLGSIEKRFGMAEFPVKGHLGLWDWKR